MVGVDEQGPFRNKNGVLSQSVLIACSFDMKFYYVLAGWEGSAADLRVLTSALTRHNKLQVPEGTVCLLQDSDNGPYIDDWTLLKGQFVPLYRTGLSFSIPLLVLLALFLY